MAFFLRPDDFVSHRQPQGQDMNLYRVYDNLSHIPRNEGEGIECGDPSKYLMHPQHIITYAAMMNHLNWCNRKPTYFISLFADLSRALYEARRRKQQRWVRNPEATNETAPDAWMYRDPASVKIAMVSARVLDTNNVFYFSTAELRTMLQVDAGHDIRTRLSEIEWFVMEYIPEEAIVGFYAV